MTRDELLDLIDDQSRMIAELNEKIVDLKNYIDDLQMKVDKDNYWRDYRAQMREM